jgi:hypothetical protein
VASAAAPATVQALERLASGSIPSRGGITACGPEPLHPWPGRPQARPSVDAPHRMRARRTAMTSVMTLIPSCGGDMSSPQKRPSTRHDSSTASDNRRYGRQPSRCGVARRRAEPRDLCAAVRIARRPIDVRICMVSDSAETARLIMHVEVGVVVLIPMGPCDGERLLAGMRMPGPRPSRAGTRARRCGRWRYAPVQEPASRGRT